MENPVNVTAKIQTYTLAKKKKQVVQLTQFAEAFAQAIDEAAKSERAKNSTSYEAPDPNDVLIDDENFKKIEPCHSVERNP